LFELLFPKTLSNKINKTNAIFLRCSQIFSHPIFHSANPIIRIMILNLPDKSHEILMFIRSPKPYNAVPTEDRNSFTEEIIQETGSIHG
jgi:hypothetical protein